MSNDPIKRLSRNYHVIITIVASVFLAGVIVMMFKDYFNHREESIHRTLDQLESRCATINANLNASNTALIAMQQWARQEFEENFAPYISPRGTQYLQRDRHARSLSLDLLPKKLQNQLGNIIYKGDYKKINSSIEREMKLTMSLFPMQKSFSQTLSNITQSFYISKSKIVSVFPWMISEDIDKLYSIGLGKKELAKLARKEIVPTSALTSDFTSASRYLKINQNDRESLFSQTYQENGQVYYLQTAGVYNKSDLEGIIGLVTSLKHLNKFTKHFEYQEAGKFYIINDKDQIVASNCSAKIFKNINAGLTEIIGEKNIKVLSSPDGSEENKGDYFLFTQNLKTPGWKVVYLVDERTVLSGFISTLTKNLIVIVAVLVFLSIANYLIRRNFVNPSIALVQHIRTEAETGEANYSDIPSDWMQWFRMVSDTLPLRAVTGNIPGSVFQVRKKDEALEIIFVSDRITDLLGVTPSELVENKSNIIGLISLDYKALAVHAFEESAKNQTPISLECPMWTASNRTVWINLVAHCRTSPDGYIVWDGIMLDISKRKKTEHALVRRDAILHAVSDAAERFLEISDWDQDTIKSMSDLGRVTNASRILLYKNSLFQGKLTASITQQWKDRNTAKPLIGEFMNNVDYDTPEMKDWKDTLQLGEAVVGKVEDFEQPQMQSLKRQNVVSVAAVPIFAGKSWWGYLRIDDCRKSRVWSGAELDALRAASSVFGAAIERSTTEKELQRVRSRELDVGWQIQKELLMGQIPPNTPRVQMDALTLPSTEIDGDFTDFIPHDARHIDVLIGDVMGKGVPAALLGAAIKSTVLQSISQLVCASNVTSLPTIEEIITSVHRKITPKMISLRSFATLCYARLDLDKYRLDLIDAGHTNTIHYHGATKSTSFLHSDNMPIGFCDNEVYQQHSYRINPGDVILFYSDGIIEAKDKSGELYGKERLAKLVKEVSHLSTEEIKQAITDRLQDFCKERFADDLTCIMIKINPPVDTQIVHKQTQVLKSDLEDLVRLRKFLKDFCSRVPNLPARTYNQIELAVNEATSNVMRHAYEGKPGKQIIIDASIYADRIEFEITHWGIPLSQLQISAPAFDGTQQHGFGLYLIRNCVDELDYDSDERGKSTVKLVKLINKQANNE